MDRISKNLFLYKFLATMCADESYPPFDGGYLRYTYGRRISSRRVKEYWSKTIDLIKKGKAPEQVGIYIHWPFCVSRCSYCFCDSFVPRDQKSISHYFESIKKELVFFADVFREVPVHSVYLGGGTPTFISDDDLNGLLSFIRENFYIDKRAQIYIEGSPHTLTPSKLEILKRNGVNRLTIGVQSLDPEVLKKANRIQTKKEFECAFAYAHGLGNFRINIDLIAGLEGQAPISFISDVRYVVKKNPDMINIYSFEPRAHTPFSRQGKKISLKQDKEREIMMRYAKKILDNSGYVSTELANFDLSSIHIEDRQSMDWSKRNASVLGIGYGAVSHAFGSLWYQHPPVEKINRSNDKKPDFFYIHSNEEEEARKFVIHRLRGGFSRKEFKDFFRKDISEYRDVYTRLKDLEKIGKISITKREVIPSMDGIRDYLILSKHLFSKKVIAALVNSHRDGYEQCLRRYDDNSIDTYVDAVLGSAYKSMKFYNFKRHNGMKS